jgi:uncharacterized FlaG/YvyC family protein
MGILVNSITYRQESKMKTLQEFVDEINSQVANDQGKMPIQIHQFVYNNYVHMFRNEFNEVPNFDVDDYGRIILLRPEVYG